MSSYSKNSRTTAGKIVLDWYKILQISPSSTPNEIKNAYYKIAQLSHPDKHNGCELKLEQFKRINEAYAILSNPMKRNEYDIKMGHHHSTTRNGQQQHQRRSTTTTVPHDYRKVYTSRPPPEWKMVWDHTRHYDMHYGDGFQKEAMKQAIKTAEQDGTFIYHSALGKGFTFHHLHDRTTSTGSAGGSTGSSRTNYNRHGATTNSMNYNPYSKDKVQGPPKIIFDYQEITQQAGSTGSKQRQHILKHERIVYDLHLRRYERYQEEVRNESSQQQSKEQQQQQQQQQQQTTGETTNGSSESDEASSKRTSSSTRKKSSIYSRYDWRYQQEQQRQQHKQSNESFLSSINLFSSFIRATTNLNGDTTTTTTATAAANIGTIDSRSCNSSSSSNGNSTNLNGDHCTIDSNTTTTATATNTNTAISGNSDETQPHHQFQTTIRNETTNSTTTTTTTVKNSSCIIM